MITTVSTEYIIPPGYIEGLGRSIPSPKVAHLYKGDFNDPGLPMCKRAYGKKGYYSIFRGNRGKKGICKICMKRAAAGLDGVEPE